VQTLEKAQCSSVKWPGNLLIFKTGEVAIFLLALFKDNKSSKDRV
jgi:hypothetical protein